LLSTNLNDELGLANLCWQFLCESAIECRNGPLYGGIGVCAFFIVNISLRVLSASCANWHWVKCCAWWNTGRESEWASSECVSGYKIARDAEWQCIFLVHQAMCGARLHLAQWVWCCAELQVIILARPAQPWHANIIGSHTHTWSGGIVAAELTSGAKMKAAATAFHKRKR